jgi:MATE family multidrug resistance protein
LSGWSASARRLLPLAWPVFIGQIAVLAFSTVDTMVVARHAALDLAALAIGGASYITIFVGLMGVVLAVGPMAGQLYGAQRLHECGAQLHQAMWLALGLSVLRSTALLFPRQRPVGSCATIPSTTASSFSTASPGRRASR